MAYPQPSVNVDVDPHRDCSGGAIVGMVIAFAFTIVTIAAPFVIAYWWG